ncbi:EmrB/QacA family drug resistance transporter [Actinomadura craniellae]|uniref:EmrB/QacA family drug resistance transporter n=1 Tax=Actinomadura craniellae TaxID=2231787 RepID=A0A365H8V3_9ACTN|nr:MDR family MFS transporter [Actinomadura craniellae]RAY15517.1 EmrB/QacA family drug resistance transporter [Actinomadura craniellae]
MAEASEEPALHGRELYAVLGALMLGMLLASLDQTIVSTALPTIVGELRGAEHLAWVVTAYLLASTAATPLWGKLGDQYGRKRLFQLAIVVFLASSALCGLAQSMGQLIAFRAVQGVGGGGLIVLAMATVGDVVPPRERGRYQGLFGAVFGVSSVLGPLLGGFFVDHLTWRWVFYINLPLGVLALFVVAVALRAPQPRRSHAIDYPGVALLAAAAVCLVLTATWGGTRYAWGSAMIVGLVLASVALLLGWAWSARRAVEPVLPPHLFGRQVFTVCSGLAFVVGFVMFGALTYLPLFLQVVHGISATMSGVHLLPMVFGLLLTSVTSGRLIARHGRYKMYPIAGMGFTALGLYLMSTMDESTSDLAMNARFLVLGLGLGMVMQVLILAVQNAVPYEDLGAATSGVTFFRSIGGAFGVSVFGAVFASRLVGNLTALVPGRLDPERVANDPALIRTLPEPDRQPYLHAYSDAISIVFAWAVPVAVAGFALAWVLRELPLRTTSRSQDLGEAVGCAPTARSSLAELEVALTRLMRRDLAARELYEGLVRKAGFDLSAGSAWALCRVARELVIRRQDLAGEAEVPVERGRRCVDPLVAAGYVERDEVWLTITSAGLVAADRLAEARRGGLAELLAGWEPERHPELVDLLTGLSRADVGGVHDRTVLGP